LSNDPFTPSLKSHKLTGRLEGLWSCAVADDYRIIFAFRPDTITGEVLIVLVDIGSHDEVYQ
jgi:mRNA interferase YafQ